MKQKDLMVIIGAAIGSAIIAFIISSKLISTPAHRQQQVPVIQTINTQFTQPDTKYFNSNSIDPTQFIHISNNANTAPFPSNNSSQ